MVAPAVPPVPPPAPPVPLAPVPAVEPVPELEPVPAVEPVPEVEPGPGAVPEPAPEPGLPAPATVPVQAAAKAAHMPIANTPAAIWLPRAVGGGGVRAPWLPPSLRWGAAPTDAVPWYGPGPD